MLFQEAVAKIGGKSVVGSALTSMQWSGMPGGLRDRAFFSATIESLRFLQRAQGMITDYTSGKRVESGKIDAEGKPIMMLAAGSRQQFVRDMNEFAVREGMGPLDPLDEGTIKDIRSEQRLSLIFNVQTQAAFDYGYRAQGMDPDVLDAFPAQRFIRVVDVEHPRQDHAPYEDGVWLKSDPIWVTINKDFGVPWGPWGWGCGHDVEDVDREEAESLGLLGPGEHVNPTLESFNQDLQASTEGLDEGMQSILRDRFGDQITIEGGTASWKGRG
jgi:hypothetical protein